MEERRFCPICGEELKKSYINGKGEQVWFCEDGNEEYVFRRRGEYVYAISVYDGASICVGIK